MENRSVKLKKCVIEIDFVEKGVPSKIILPKKFFGIEDDCNFVAIKKEGSDMVKLFPYLKSQRLFELYAEIKEGQLDKFYQAVVRIVAETDGLNLKGMDGLCTKSCAFDGCLVVDGLAEAIVCDLRDKLESLGNVEKLNIREVK